MTVSLAAVIVHWGDPEETRACIEALRSEAPDRVFVVDNGTRVPIADALRQATPPVDVMRLAMNRGYAGGANAGIAAALAEGADTILLLNNDARVVPGASAAARARLARDARIGVVGAKVVTREDPTRLWLAWGDVTYRQSLVALHGADVPDAPEWSVARDVAWVAGCAMWFRSQALRDVGLLDEAFFAYHEEVDWCARAAAAGWRVVYEPAAVVSHTGRGSHGTAEAIRIRKYFAARNAILFARKHATLRQWATLLGFLGCSLPLELVWHLVRGDAANVALKVRGVRDGLLDRRPPFATLGLE
jgi:hypothetical protein